MLNLVAVDVPFSYYPYPHQCARSIPISRWVSSKYYYSSFERQGVRVLGTKWSIRLSFSLGNGPVEDERIVGFGVKEFDLVTLGNLCVDVVLNVPELPPKPLEQRKSFMEELSKLPPDKRNWEAGGNSNVAIAAARLGLHVACVGHVGNEIYGHFLLDVLHKEGISMVDVKEKNDGIACLNVAYETLLCWVLIDPWQRHGFCSRADFCEEPAFSWLSELSTGAKKAIRSSKIIFCNGYGFDELSPRVLMSALDYAVEVGTSIFFDPGPRGKSLINGIPEEQLALHKYMSMSDVLLLTSEEAESLTGTDDPILSGKELLRRGIRTKWVIIKMGSKGSILISASSISCSPAFKVNVLDTVGCGDSFVAAIAFGYIHKLPLVSTLTIANAVGGATAMGCGAGRNVATLKQVMLLLSGANLHEDSKIWEEMLKEHSDNEEIMLVSKIAVNGRHKWLKHASLQKVVGDLLPKLQSSQINRVGAC